MPDPSELLEAAEQAAASGHYAVAEPLLREAASLQEELLGPRHPDVANTLNNLGIVCEILGKPEIAEECFRRACAIAAASLDPTHPFVATSRKNLEEFCNARGLPVDLPWAVKPAAQEPAPARPAPARPEPARVEPAKPESVKPESVKPESVKPEPVKLEPLKPVPAPRPVVPMVSEILAPPARPATPEPAPPASASRMIIMAALAAVILLVVAIVTLRRAGVQEAPPPATTAPATPSASSPPATTPTRTPAPSPAAPVESKPAATAKPAPSRPVQAAKGGAVTVSEAGVCRDLATTGNWRCTPIAPPIAPTRLFFYTRVKSATDTSIQQRWYRGDRLVKSAELSVRANPTAGYRTYSRNTVTAGEWRLEVRTKDGTVLHEERFTVR
jgi:hypothetical protein